MTPSSPEVSQDKNLRSYDASGNSEPRGQRKVGDPVTSEQREALIAIVAEVARDFIPFALERREADAIATASCKVLAASIHDESVRAAATAIESSEASMNSYGAGYDAGFRDGLRRAKEMIEDAP